MSRSYRKTTVTGHTSKCSEKKDKRLYNSALRCLVRRELRICADLDELVLSEVRNVSNQNAMSKDGKSFDCGLAAFRASLGRLARNPGGRKRRQLVLSARSYEHMKAELNRRLASRIFASLRSLGISIELSGDPDLSDIRRELGCIYK